MDEQQISLGQYIAKRRKVLNLTQGELGAKVGRTETTIANWESDRNKVPYETLDDLVTALEEKSPVTVYALAGVLDKLPGGRILWLIRELPPDEVERLERLAETFVRTSKS